jgi:putative peptide zinc metalloprotease protein
VQLETVPDHLLPGTRGRAIVIGRTQTIGQRVLRFLNLNFRFAT